MAAESVLLILGVLIVAGYAAEFAFRRYQVPDVFLLILIGLMISWFYPLYGSPLESFVPTFTTFALIFILFEGALRLDVKQLVKFLPRALALTSLSFVLTAAVTLGLSILMGLGWEVGLFLGFILGGISSAIVIPMVRFLKLSDKATASLTLESALSDVLCIISTVILTSLLVLGQASPNTVLKDFLGTILIALFLGGALGFVWARVLRRTGTHSGYFLSVALLLVLYSVTEWIGADGAIACLVFGIVLGNAKQVKLHLTTEKKIEAETRDVLSSDARMFYSEISFFVKTFFFIYLGMLVDFSNPISFLYGAVLVVGFLAARPLAVWVSGVAENTHEAAVVEAMVPKGLAAAVLASYPIQAGLEGLSIIPNIVVAGIVLSILATSTLVFLAQKGRFSGVYRVAFHSRHESGA